MSTEMEKVWWGGRQMVVQRIPEEVIYKREWVGLTDEDRHVARSLNKTLALQFVEAKLKEKNNGN